MKKSLVGLVGVGAFLMAFALVACGEKEVPVEVVKEVIVEKEVAVEKIVVKEVAVEKEVVKEVVVVKEVIATAVPVSGSFKVELAKYGGTLRVTSQGSLSQLDPLALKGAAEKVIATHMWDGLFDADLTYTAQPVIADSWTISSDGLTYTMKIRSGLTFHDGSPITSDDIIQSIPRWMDSRSAGGRALKGFVADAPLKKVDDLTFSITLKEPFRSTIEAFGDRTSVYVFPQDVGEIESQIDMGEDNYSRGSGPYMLYRWLKGDRVELARYEGYKSRTDAPSYQAGRRAQYLDKIVYLEVPAEETKIAGLKTDLYDVVEVVGLDFFGTLNAHSEIEIHGGSARASGIWFNLSFPDSITTKDVKIRQAILAGMNMEDFLAALGPKELWWNCAHRYGPCKGKKWRWESTAADHLYDQNDLARAKQLLAESIYDGEPVHIMAPTDYATITPIGPVMKQTMERIGFNVEMPAINWANLLSRLGSQDFDLFTSWTRVETGPLADGFVDLGYAWVREWPDRTLPGLKAKFLRAATIQEQKAAVDELQLYYYDVIPWLQIGYFAAPDAYRKKVQGLGAEMENVFSLYYGNVWLKK